MSTNNRNQSINTNVNASDDQTTDAMVHQVNLAAAFHDHISCTKISQQSITNSICAALQTSSSSTITVIADDPHQPNTRTMSPMSGQLAIGLESVESDHMYATDNKSLVESANGLLRGVGGNSLMANSLTSERNQISRLTEMILGQLDLIQHQQEQLLKKDRQLQGLKQDREALCLRLEKMEKKIAILMAKVANNNKTTSISSSSSNPLQPSVNSNNNLIVNNTNYTINSNKSTNILTNNQTAINNVIIETTDCGDQSNSDTIVESETNSIMGLVSDPIHFTKLNINTNAAMTTTPAAAAVETVVTTTSVVNNNNVNSSQQQQTSVTKSNTTHNVNNNNNLLSVKIKTEPLVVVKLEPEDIVMTTSSTATTTTTTTTTASTTTALSSGRKSRKRHLTPEKLSSATTSSSTTKEVATTTPSTPMTTTTTTTSSATVSSLTTTPTSSATMGSNKKRNKRVVNIDLASKTPVVVVNNNNNKESSCDSSSLNTFSTIKSNNKVVNNISNDNNSIGITNNNRKKVRQQKSESTSSRTTTAATTTSDSTHLTTNHSFNYRTHCVVKDILITTKPYNIFINNSSDDNNCVAAVGNDLVVDNSNDNKVVNNSLSEETNSKNKSKLNSDLSDSEVIEVPNWRLHPVSSCYSLEGTENLDDEVFNRRHLKLENDERRRKRWDIQRLREQRHNEKLRTGRYYSSSLGNCVGGVGGSGIGGGDKQSDPKKDNNNDPDFLSFYPDIDDLQSLEVTEKIPVIAFGHPIPKLPSKSFTLPWITVSGTDRCADNVVVVIGKSTEKPHTSGRSSRSTPHKKNN
ncbi:rhoGEF domain-containing protein gxcI-like [Oppia nitens]|uniref:rhoGEF domain-containing protein gxcI-like n=1 Tax=Oppia nitens TaxID=1686743 RepID=UPI0023DA2BBE|nr:rhoGEF domain-containing protein gxcI-like [Oppia nitens]